MGHFVSIETTKIELDNNEFVEIKRKMGLGDYDYIDKQSSRNDGAGQLLATLEACIIAWNLKDNGIALPLTRANIRRLDNETATKIFVEIGKSNNVILPKVEDSTSKSMPS